MTTDAAQPSLLPLRIPAEAATRPWSNTGPPALIVQPLAEVIGVESPVGEQPAVAQNRRRGVSVDRHEMSRHTFWPHVPRQSSKECRQSPTGS
jgi:hypothetical protein